MSDTQALLKANAKWAADVSEMDPNFFPDSAKYPQKPHVRPLLLCFLLNSPISFLDALDRLC